MFRKLHHILKLKNYHMSKEFTSKKVKYQEEKSPMNSLKYTHGVVMSGKTARLIEDIENAESENIKFYLMKPDTDYSVNKNYVISRNGKRRVADVIIFKDIDILNDICYNNIGRIFVDEIQFLSKEHVDQLRRLTLVKSIDVFCYGIKTDFMSFLFEGSKRMLEIADEICECVAKCNFCATKKASYNIKCCNGRIITSGDVIDLNDGGEEKYYPCCFVCFEEKTKISNISRN